MPLTTAIAAALAVAAAAPAASPSRPLGEKRSSAPDASLAGSIAAAPAAPAVSRGPELEFETFRYKVEGQVSGKRRQEIADLEKLVQLGGSEQEMPGWLFRLGELHWEESQYLFFEANRRDDDLARAGGAASPDASRLRAEKRDLEARSRAEQERAIERYREIARRHPSWSRLDEVVFFLGENLWKQNRRKEALEAYKALLTRFPKSRFVADAWIAVGESWFDLAENGDRVANLNRALESYRRAAAQTSSTVGGYALYKQGWVHYNLGQWHEALQLFEAVIRRGAPTGADSEKSLALSREARKDYVRTYVHVGAPKSAYDVFRRAAGEAHAREMTKNLAALYYDSGKDREAILTYHRLIEADPGSPDGPLFQARIVTAAGRLGRKDLAARQAREFVSVLERAGASPASRTEDGKRALEVARREAENTLRTLAVQYHNEWRKTRDDQVAALAESLYRDHLQLFPDHPNSLDLRFFHAELLFALARYQQAGDEYGRVIDATLKQPAQAGKPRHLVESLESAVHAYGEVAKRSAIRDRKPVARQARIPFGPAEKQLVDACERYLRHAPRGDKAVEIAYQGAQLYYQHNALAESVPLFARIATDHPRHELARYAANLALDALNLAGEYREMNSLARRFVAHPELLRAHPALRDDLGRVVEQSAFKLVEELEKAKKNVEAAEAWLAFARDWRSSKLAPTALHNAAVNFVAAGRLEAAMAARAELLERYPGHTLAPKAIAASAQDHAATADFDKAASLWERYYAEWKKADERREATKRMKRGAAARQLAAQPDESPRWEEAVARDAIHDAGVLREGLGQYRKAEQDRIAFLASWPNAKEAPRVFLSMADLYAKEDAPAREARHVLEYQKKYARDADEWLASQNRVTRALERAGDTAGARRAALEAFAYWKKRKPKVSDRGLGAVAQGMLLDLDDDLAAYDRIRFDGGQRQLQGRLAEKARRLEALQRAYTEVVELKQPEPAVCALWRIGDAYRRFGAALRDAPLPPEVRGKPALVAEYRAQLAKFAAEPERKGLEGVELAVAKARELNVSNACAREALASAVKLKPAEYAPPVEALPDDPAIRAGPVAPAPYDADAAPGLDLERELEGDARRDDDPRGMLREASSDLDAGRPESAWRRVRRALLEVPSAPEAFPLLMRAALQQKKPDLAHLVALRAERLAPSTPEIAYLRGRAYQAQKQSALARAEWIRAADAGRDDARRALLHVEFANRNWPGVAVHATELLRRHPDDAVAQLALGVSLRHAGRPDEALATYALAEKLGGGKLAEVHFARAILFARVKADCGAAVSELRRYALLAGPGASGEASVLLQRDCERSRAGARAVSATTTGAGHTAPSAVHADTQADSIQTTGAPAGSPRP